MNPSSPQLFAGLTAVSLALVISSWIGGQSIQQLKNADNTVSVVGAARKAIKADYGIWEGSVAVERPTLKEAYTALQNDMQRVRDYLITEQKLPETAISIQALQSSPISEVLPNGNNSGKIRAYRASQQIEVRLEDVNRIEALSKDVSSLVTQDISIESYPPRFLYTKLEDLRVEMLSEATQDARKRAEQIVKSAGSHLGPVRSVRTGVFQITRPHSTEVSDGGMYDTQTIDKEITAVLTMSFAVN